MHQATLLPINKKKTVLFSASFLLQNVGVIEI